MIGCMYEAGLSRRGGPWRPWLSRDYVLGFRGLEVTEGLCGVYKGSSFGIIETYLRSYHILEQTVE